MRRYGLRTEVLLSFGLVVVLATVVLVAVLVTHHEQGLRRVLGRALHVEASGPLAPARAVQVGTEWWTVAQDGTARPRGAFAGEIGSAELELARAAGQTGETLLQLGSLGDRIRFATPIGSAGQVAVARLPAEASTRLRTAPVLVMGVLGLANIGIFTIFGSRLLQRRLILPLEAVAAAADEIGGGAREIRAPVTGPAEVAGVAGALNAMTDAWHSQSEELEKAVADLRSANRELRQARAGLDRAERLASVGRLAAGVAHEVGNPIGAILAFIDLALRDDELTQETRGHLQRASGEGERVRTILRQLLDFSRPASPQPRPIDLGSVAAEALALVSPQRRYSHIDWQAPPAESLPAVSGDPSAVIQILLNLLLNAADAIGPETPGTVALRVRPAVLERRRGETPGAVLQRRTPDAVECLVCDDGCGIPEADRERIFDPFFTTKPPGEGTGLGLANCARLAEELGGSVEWVPAPPGFATALALRLPVAPAADPAQVRNAAP